MRKFFDTIIDPRGEPVQNAEIRVTDGAGNPVQLYSDNAGAQLGQPILTTALGYYEFYVANGNYTLDMRYPTSPTRLISGIQIYDDGAQQSTIDQLVSDVANLKTGLPMIPGATAVIVGARSGMSAIVGQEDGTPVYLTEVGREGTFVWRLGDYSAAVTADPTQLFYVVADSVASSTGAWVRSPENGKFQQSGTGAVPRTVQAKLRDRPDVRDFLTGGNPGDSPASWPDITTGLQAYLDACVSLGTPIYCDTPIFGRVSSTITVVPSYFTSPTGDKIAHPIDLWNLTLVPTGTRNRVVVDIGTAAGGTLLDRGVIRLPRVIASGALQWPGTLATADTAIRLRNIWRTEIHQNYIYGFTKGVEYLGAAYLRVTGNLIYDCKYGRVWNTEGSNHDASFVNENSIRGGAVSCTSAAAGLGARYGEVFTWDKTASYRGHNNNRFHDINYELGSGGTDPATPVWLDGVGVHNHWTQCRAEGGYGPLALVDGGGAANLGYDNHFDFTFNQGSGQRVYVRQINGACGNRMTGPGCNELSWHSGDMGKLAVSSGSAAAYLKGREFFLLCASTPTPADASRLEPTAGYLFAHRSGIGLVTGGNARAGIAIDTSAIKDFLCAYEAPDGFVGRPYFMALGADGSPLTGAVTDADGTENYAKGTSLMEPNVLVDSTNGYRPAADIEGARSLHVTVRDEVKTLLFCVGGGTGPAVLRSMSVTGYAVPNKIGSAYPVLDGITGLRVFSPLDDDGAMALVTANPASSGKHGYYARGTILGSATAATGTPSGYVATAAGFLAPAWTVSTAYAVLGLLAANGGKVYELTTAGTSAASGGPTGTGAIIADGTCVWKYAGVVATFAAMGNLA